MNTALLLIDIQNDYFAGGKAELVEPLLAAENAHRILEYFRREKLPVIHVQHINTRQGATFFLPDSSGVEIHAKVKPLADEVIVTKNFPNSFLATNLDEVLQKKNVSKLVVCGMMTHMCIDTTVRACQERNLAVTLLSDACATKDLSFANEVIPAKTVHNAFMAALDGMFAQVIKTQDYLAK